ncbi:MAG: hypothetical protein HQK58_06825 [Deltaproteobacteria bacterium]|nr:hypothetical protein [Deltaproteobacteria bacterium]
MIIEVPANTRRKFGWSKRQKALAEHVIQKVEELQDYQPLTLRQVYYRLVASEIIPNKKTAYSDLSSLISRMRIDRMLPWEAVEDRVRRVTTKQGIENPLEFIKQQVERFGAGYRRCLVQNQRNYVEVWCEKDALAKIFESVANGYCLRTVVCRGYNSTSFLHDYSIRANEAIERDQTPVVIYFGDLDPSGWNCLEATAISLRDDFGLENVVYDRAGLNPDQVSEFSLPCSVDALKDQDTRSKSYIKRFGRIAVELDAVHPRDLEALAKDAIFRHLGFDMMVEQYERQKTDQEKVTAIKSWVTDVVNYAYSEGILQD